MSEENNSIKSQLNDVHEQLQKSSAERTELLQTKDAEIQELTQQLQTIQEHNTEQQNENEINLKTALQESRSLKVINSQ